MSRNNKNNKKHTVDDFTNKVTDINYWRPVYLACLTPTNGVVQVLASFAAVGNQLKRDDYFLVDYYFF
ncbi:hypothetical protein RhiirA4_487685 [Rhizophagus irregularis]|uniref:Uncharacterized protein n=1 Tax=Rhizophagus irregularis TaxID=588596 RepID=A0A2I1HSY5_9GLOM|nr:hypothetical protein RhiirA4_487685 [Rhizophagus irregularis]